ncbi:MAG: hypothetical protein EOL97_02815 [Spirochaetia bacterium]|nr:hypothetical protein [Spirochaetia bacterium]
MSSEKSKYTFNWELKNQDIVKIKNTIDFINCINNNKNTKLYTLASHKFICNLIFNSYNSIKINKNFETYINNLYTLSYELNLPFYFNETFNERDINNAYKLTSIINHNEINNPIIKFSTDDNILLKDFYNKILNYDNLIIDYNNEEIKILNQTLNLADFFQYNIIGINNIEIIDNSIIISASKIQTIIKDDESIFESKKN